jgi:hypothetical protein
MYLLQEPRGLLQRIVSDGLGLALEPEEVVGQLSHAALPQIGPSAPRQAHRRQGRPATLASKSARSGSVSARTRLSAPASRSVPSAELLGVLRPFSLPPATRSTTPSHGAAAKRSLKASSTRLNGNAGSTRWNMRSFAHPRSERERGGGRCERPTHVATFHHVCPQLFASHGGQLLHQRELLLGSRALRCASSPPTLCACTAAAHPVLLCACHGVHEVLRGCDTPSAPRVERRSRCCWRPHRL